jgi:hypothetical protein
MNIGVGTHRVGAPDAEIANPQEPIDFTELPDLILVNVISLLTIEEGMHLRAVSKGCRDTVDRLTSKPPTANMIEICGKENIVSIASHRGWKSENYIEDHAVMTLPISNVEKCALAVHGWCKPHSAKGPRRPPPLTLIVESQSIVKPSEFIEERGLLSQCYSVNLEYSVKLENRVASVNLRSLKNVAWIKHLNLYDIKSTSDETFLHKIPLSIKFHHFFAFLTHHCWIQENNFL